MTKIVLIGYMGSGKTTIAKLLSEKLGMIALDLDEIIEEKANLPVASIFEQKGEVYFRKLEHTSLKELLGDPRDLILSLGGGTPCYANNHELLSLENVVSIYLKASIDTLFGILTDAKSKRPLIAALEGEALKEFIAMHLFERSFYYNHAQYKVAIDGKSPDATAAEIIALLA